MPGDLLQIGCFLNDYAIVRLNANNFSQAQAFTAADHVIEDWENYRIERKPNDEEVKLLLEHRNIPYINWYVFLRF